jgi:hypothetical protein
MSEISTTAGGLLAYDDAAHRLALGKEDGQQQQVIHIRSSERGHTSSNYG